MSVIGGQNIPVTNGLVYALDFKNNKCYISGSNILKSIYYDPVTTIVTGSFTASAGNTNLSISSPTYRFSVYSENDFYIQRTGSTFNFDQNSTFTISTVLNVRIPGAFLFQNTTNSKFAAQVSTSSLDIGFYNPLTENYYTRRFPVNLQTGSVHLVYRYDNGTSDVFLNGIPVTSSQTNVVPTALSVTSYRSNIKFNSISSSLYTGYLGIRGTAPYEPTSIVTPYSGSISSFAVYSRVLTSTEIYSLYVQSNPTLFPGAYNKPYSLDENALMYISASGITSSTYITAIDNFVTGLKSAGLWNKLSAVYPTVGSTTSSQALNLKEPGVNRLTYSGSWTASTLGAYPSSSTSYLQLAGFDYPTIATSSAHITYLSYDLPQVTASLVAVDKPLAATGGEIFYSGSRTYHVFKPTGTSSFTVLSPALTAVEVLAVGGGGAGGLAGYSAGGGGAGGLVYSSSFTVSPQTYTVVVGEGGYPGLNGLNTTFSTITAYGGGAGNSGNGGSGGGAGSTFNTTGSGGTASYAGQGNNGGDSLAIYVHGAGGGGGAGTPGQIAGAVPSRGGAGGSGSYFGQYAGLNLGSPAGWFAGGGGGCNSFANSGISGAGPGGIGGGARALIGTDYDSTYQVVAGYGPGAGNGAPTASKNTGGGGGGGSYNNGVAGCGAGGSGIVIISYNSSQAAFTSSFGLSLTNTDIVGNLHSTTTSGITGGGIVGLVTVSRTGSTSISLHQDVTSSIISAPVTASILGSVYGNASNYAGVPSKFGTTTLSYLSYGAGLSPSEVSSYHTLVSKLQYDLGRGLLIQGYPAAAAYSVRQLSKTARYAMTVRRDSDNLTFDVGFDNNGNLNTGSLLTNMTASLNTPTLPGDYSGLAAAYSLRRVSSSYTGYTIDVRRDSDNTTGSIGFNLVGGLDTGSLLAFVTGSSNTGSGFVARWYDQSINGKHATQTVTGSQPLIVSSGSLITSSFARPSVKFDGVNDYLDIVSFNFSSSNFNTFVGTRENNGDWYFGLAGQRYFYGIASDNNYNMQATSSGYLLSTATNTTPGQLLLTGLNNGISQSMYVSGITIPSTYTTYALSTTIDSIGNYLHGSYYTKGKLQEIIYYNNNQTVNKNLIEDNINGYYNIFTQSLASSSGYVTQWYDQSGNGNHATQTATGSQPLIVRSGSFITASGKLLLDFDGVNDFLNIGSNFTGTFANLSAVAKLKSDTPANEVAAPIIGSVGSSTGYGLYYKQNGLNEEFGITTRIQYNNFSTPLLSNLHNYMINVKDNTFNAYLNNTNIHSTTGISIGFRTTGNPRIGSHVGGSLTNYISGSIAEVIVWTTDQVANRLTISNNVNSYFNIY